MRTVLSRSIIHYSIVTIIAFLALTMTSQQALAEVLFPWIYPPVSSRFYQTGLPSDVNWGVQADSTTKYYSSSGDYGYIPWDLAIGTSYTYTVPDGYECVSGCSGEVKDYSVGYITYATYEKKPEVTWNLVVAGGEGKVCVYDKPYYTRCTESSTTATVAVGEYVTLFAYPKDGYSFVKFDGYEGGETSSNPIMFYAEASGTIYAYFSPVTFTSNFYTSGLPSGAYWYMYVDGAKHSSTSSSLSVSGLSDTVSYSYQSQVVYGGNTYECSSGCSGVVTKDSSSKTAVYEMVSQPECTSGVCCDIATGKFKSSTTMCRAAVGNCDVAEYCTGSSASCPADSYKSSSYVCNSKEQTEYGCPWGTTFGNDVGVRYMERRCSGDSPYCTGLTSWGSWSVADYCSYSEYCTPGVPACVSAPQCTDECSAGAEESRCSGGIVQKRTCGNYDSDSCTEWSSWTDVENCNSNDGCYGTTYRDYYCSNGACSYTSSYNDARCTSSECTSGACCDTTTGTFKPSGTVCRASFGPCDVAEYCTGSSASCPDDLYRPSSYVCDSDIDVQYSCPWGTGYGSDVGVRYLQKYCSGTGSSCDGSTAWTPYSIADECSSNEYCTPGVPACVSGSQCTDECSAGAEESRCSGGIVQKRTCGNYDSDSCTEWSSWTDVENCNSNDGCYGTTYRDYYCSNGACSYTSSYNDYRCTSDTCYNECSAGAEESRCSGGIVQKRTCGNYDSDSCTEWSSWTDVENCNSNDGCYGTTYRDYYCSGGSCSYTSIYNDYRCDSDQSQSFSASISRPSDSYERDTVSARIKIQNFEDSGRWFNFNAYVCRADGYTNCVSMDCDYNRLYVSGDSIKYSTCSKVVKDSGKYAIKLVYWSDSTSYSKTAYSSSFYVKDKSAESQSDYRCFGDYKQQKYLDDNYETRWKIVEYCPYGCDNSKCVLPDELNKGLPKIYVDDKYDLEKCSVSSFTFKVRNTGEDSMIDLKVSGDAAEWIQVPESVAVKRGETKIITGYASVPCDVSAGLHTFKITGLGNIADSKTGTIEVLQDDGYGKSLFKTDIVTLLIILLIIFLVLLIAYLIYRKGFVIKVRRTSYEPEYFKNFSFLKIFIEKKKEAFR